jgi:hypothetical protein
MSAIIDSYSESYYNNTYSALYNGYRHGIGQSITGITSNLNIVKWYASKSGSPTGNAVAKIYNETHATAFGTDSLPTGAALATSDNFDVSSLSTSYLLRTFIFTGVNKINLSAGTYYVVTLEYSGGDISNYVKTGSDTATLGHTGNSVQYGVALGAWSASSTLDRCFYVFKSGGFNLTLVGAG